MLRPNPVNEAIAIYAAKHKLTERQARKAICEVLRCSRVALWRWRKSGAVGTNFLLRFALLTGKKPADLNDRIKRLSGDLNA